MIRSKKLPRPFAVSSAGGAGWSNVALALSLLFMTSTSHADSLKIPTRSPLVGVNMSGAEFNGGKSGAHLNTDYVYPTGAELDWARMHHMTAIRLPVLWERLQPVLDGPLDAGELQQLDAVLAAAASRHLHVIIDLHDYGAYRGNDIGGPKVSDASFATVWRLIALHEAATPNAVFGLMNEPHTIAASRWAISVAAAIHAIRGTGARNLILVSATRWDGAHSFLEGGADSNAAALETLRDPADNMAIELHQYFDGDYSGTHTDCLAPSNAVATLAPVTDWLRRTRHQGFLGEFGVTSAPGCLATLDAVLSHLDRNRDVWLGWTYWTAGAWMSHYMFSVEPVDGGERPQMDVLARHLQPIR